MWHHLALFAVSSHPGALWNGARVLILTASVVSVPRRPSINCHHELTIRKDKGSFMPWRSMVQRPMLQAYVAFFNVVLWCFSSSTYRFYVDKLAFSEPLLLRFLSKTQGDDATGNARSKILIHINSILAQKHMFIERWLRDSGRTIVISCHFMSFHGILCDFMSFPLSRRSLQLRGFSNAARRIQVYKKDRSERNLEVYPTKASRSTCLMSSPHDWRKLFI